jgi:catechol-2,3-dioxygenase
MTAPSSFCHVVYKTHRYDETIAWYRCVLEARIQHRDDRLRFPAYDDEHHRMAFVNLGPGEARNASAPRVPLRPAGHRERRITRARPQLVG